MAFSRCISGPSINYQCRILSSPPILVSDFSRDDVIKMDAIAYGSNVSKVQAMSNLRTFSDEILAQA